MPDELRTVSVGERHWFVCYDGEFLLMRDGAGIGPVVVGWRSGTGR